MNQYVFVTVVGNSIAASSNREAALQQARFLVEHKLYNLVNGVADTDNLGWLKSESVNIKVARVLVGE